MKKHFLTCFAALSIAAIAISADRSNPVKQGASTTVSMYDTVPNTMDTANRWKDTTGENRDTSMMRRDSSLHK